MSGEPEIIIGREIDDVLAVESRFRRALRLQHAQALIGALLAPLVQLIAEIGKRIGHEFSLPPASGSGWRSRGAARHPPRGWRRPGRPEYRDPRIVCAGALRTQSRRARNRSTGLRYARAASRSR